MVDVNVDVQDPVVVLEELKDGEHNVVHVAEPRRLSLQGRSRGISWDVKRSHCSWVRQSLLPTHHAAVAHPALAQAKPPAFLA
jgi:hypothetical protein